MRIYFNDTFCKKCPFGEEKVCFYKQKFYQHALPPYSRLKVTHKCEYYRKIFYTGQLVVIDLYHQVPDPAGGWRYVVARTNVTGQIKGIRGSKYLIELFEPCILERRNKARFFFQASQPAKMIRTFDCSLYDADDSGNRLRYRMAGRELVPANN